MAVESDPESRWLWGIVGWTVGFLTGVGLMGFVGWLAISWTVE